MDLVLEKLLPGQRIGASAWFGYAKGLLGEAGMENFAKEPTLFKHTDPGNQSALIMHADDGILASTPEERKRILKVLGAKVKVQVSSPLREPGSEVEFLKRRYVVTEDGVVVYSNGKYLESLLKAWEAKGERGIPPQTQASRNLTTARSSPLPRPSSTASVWDASSTWRIRARTCSSQHVF